ncbi:MAG: hypothetical protein RRB13_01055 [bacterium]|nr:hypothetical protein [bacterium]
MSILASCGLNSTSPKPAAPDAAAYELRLWAQAEVGGKELKLLEAGLATPRQAPLLVPFGGVLKSRAEIIGPEIAGVDWQWSVAGNEPQRGPRFRYEPPSAGPFDLVVTASIRHKDRPEPLQISRSYRWIAAGEPGMQLLEPKGDQVLKPGQSITLRASGADGMGQRPLVIWTAEVEGVQRLIGFGESLKTDRFSVGYNRVRAMGLDAQGNLVQSEQVGLLVPDPKGPIEIVSPPEAAVLQENKPVYLFARGADLQHSLDGEPFRPGPGSLRLGLKAGSHVLKVKGRRGEAERKFEVVSGSAPIGQVTALDGKLLKQVAPGTWIGLKVGDALSPGDRLRATEGWAELHFDDGLVYKLNRDRSVQLLPGGGLAENLTPQEAAVYRIVDEKGIAEAVAQLKPFVGQLEQLLQDYQVQSVRTEDKADLERLLRGIRNGEIQLEEILIY